MSELKAQLQEKFAGMSRALCKLIDENLSEYKNFEGIAKHENFEVT